MEWVNKHGIKANKEKNFMYNVILFMRSQLSM